MTMFMFHLFVASSVGDAPLMYRRRVACNDRMHFMNKLNRWNRLSMEQNMGYTYVALTDGDPNMGASSEYVESRVSPDIYLEASSCK